MSVIPSYLPEHSPLGASGASRWIACPASVELSEGCDDSESEYAATGTGAHKLAEACLTENKLPWQFVGEVVYRDEDFNDIRVDVEMANAVQEYLDGLETWHPKEDRNQANFTVEREFYCPSLHPMFYGKADAVFIDDGAKTLHVWDYKHGAGIVVDAENNPQLMYYGCGVLEELSLWEDMDEVVLHIAQPRGFHFAGPIRQWSIDVGLLEDWLDDILLPAMDQTLPLFTRLQKSPRRPPALMKSGEHCRFCPARSYACPQLMQDMNELEALMEKAQKLGGAHKLSNEELGRLLELHEVSKIVVKAAKETAFARLQNGNTIPGWKLGAARVNREWKEDAEKEAKKVFKDKAFETKMLSPAKIEALPKGKEFAARYAFKPEAGLNVIRESDARPAVNKEVKSMFQPTKKGKK